jgi:uncharacterized membrane protein
MGGSGPFLVACAVIAGVSVPLILKAVPPNRWYGIRTAQTMSNSRLWFRANRFAGWAFLAASGVSAAAFVLVPAVASAYGALVLVVPLGVALGLSLAYLRRAAVDASTDDR